MADKDQAQAGHEADASTAADPNVDTADSPTNGTNPMASYEAEFAAAMSAAPDSDDDEQGDEPAGDEGADGEDGEEQAGDEGQDDSTGADSGDEGADEAEGNDGGEGDDGKGDDDSDDDDQSGDEDQLSKRYRFENDQDRAVASLAKAEGITLVEAAERYSKMLKSGSESEDSSGGEGGGEPAKTVKSVNEEISSLRTKRNQAQRDLEFEEVADLDAQIDALLDQREELRFSEARAEEANSAKEEKAYYDAYAASEKKAVSFYPDASKEDSSLSKEIARLDKQAEDLGDELFYSPDKPFLLAKKAAANLGILMVNPSAKPVKKPASTSKNRPIQPAGGNAGTSAPSRSANSLDQAMDGIESEYDYEQLLESATKRAS